MFLINIKNIVLFSLIMFLSGVSQASVQAVVIVSEYKPGSWQPLPADKIEQAAVYSALQEISVSKHFAFFQNKPKGIVAGELIINVTLVEAAQTASVNISLALPNQATIYTTHSASLKNLYYDGIYNQFKLAGKVAGEKLIIAYNKKYPSTKKVHTDKIVVNTINRLDKRLTEINKMVFQQTNIINTIKNESRLKAVIKEYNKIERVFLALEKQDSKLDTIINEVSQINKKIDQTPVTQVNVNQKYILENAVTGQSSIPQPGKKGIDDAKAQGLYSRAQKEKRNSKYHKAEKLLTKALGLRTSPELKTLISDELFYHLPLFEAQAIAINLGRDFQKYSSQNKHTKMLNRIRSRYEFALANNQNNFQRTLNIQQALDQHINTSRAMSATLSVQARSNFIMIHRQMQERMMFEGQFPDKSVFEKMLVSSRLKHKVLTYDTKKYGYNASLRSPNGQVLQLEYDGRDFNVIE